MSQPRILDLAAVIIDCAEPGSLAHFYAAATGGHVVKDEPDGAWVELGGSMWIFRQVDGYRPPTWPDDAEQLQVHLDFFVDDMETATAALQQLGARVAEHQPHGQPDLLVLLDPGGRPFCIGPR